MYSIFHSGRQALAEQWKLAGTIDRRCTEYFLCTACRSISVTKFAVSATRFMSGKFPLMIFRTYLEQHLQCIEHAKPEKKKAVAGLLLSAALTSMITGITEPLEFTFLIRCTSTYMVFTVYLQDLHIC